MSRHVEYRGEWTPNEFRVFRNGVPLAPEPSQALWNHSPDGFAWGYQGSGPAQLALALLYDVLRDRVFALEHYQAFKRAVVSRWPRCENWSITSIDILKWMSLQLADANLN